MAVTNQALTATNALRGNIDTKKSQLYTDNRAAADPGSAASAAASAAQSLQPTAPSNPLANVFSDFFSNIGNLAALNNARSISGQAGGVTTYGGTGKSGSVQTIGQR